MTKAEEKKILREKIRRMERELPDRYRRESETRIASFLLSAPAYHAAQNICCFVSMEHEINTRPILLEILSHGKRLYLPRCAPAGQLDICPVENLDNLIPGPMNIPEPGPEIPAASPDELDLVIVPCLSCNRQGDRLGHGGGYYDRFLAGYHGTAFLICRERLLWKEIPVESHDIAVPWVLTERGLYEDGVPERL